MCVRRTAESVLLMCWPPAPRGAVGVDAHVGRVDVDLDRVVDLGVDEHAGEAGVAAAGGVERRLAHQAVHAGLGAQQAEGVVALDLDGRALDAGDVARRSRPSTSVLKPLRSQYFRYWRSSMLAQSQASVPPAPAWMSRKQLRGSAGLLNMRRNSRSSTDRLELGGVGLDRRAGRRRRLRPSPSRTARCCRPGSRVRWSMRARPRRRAASSPAQLLGPLRVVPDRRGLRARR